MLALSDLVLSLLSSVVAQAPEEAADAKLDETTYPVFRAAIAARPEELGWEELPWLPTYHQGLAKASEEGKPLLLWAMNGHPLGCT